MLLLVHLVLLVKNGFTIPVQLCWMSPHEDCFATVILWYYCPNKKTSRGLQASLGRSVKPAGERILPDRSRASREMPTLDAQPRGLNREGSFSSLSTRKERLQGYKLRKKKIELTENVGA